MTGLLRTDLSGIEEHVEAMLTATTTTASLAVLESAGRRHLGGVRLLCQRHGGTYTFVELHRHAKLAHQPGDVVPAPPDPRDRGRLGEREDDL